MLTGLPQSIVLFLIMISFYAIDVLSFRKYERHREAAGKGRSWDFTLMVLVACALLLLQPPLLPWLGLRIEAFWGLVVQIAGIALAVAALALNAWARHHLRQFYAERVEVQPHHQLVDTGPYAFVRHPLIVSFFGLAISTVLVNPAVPTLLVMLYTFWDFGNAARQEEKLLAESVPGYIPYMERTPRFLPRLGRRRMTTEK